jgi:hypothetical protein
LANKGKCFSAISFGEDWARKETGSYHFPAVFLQRIRFRANENESGLPKRRVRLISTAALREHGFDLFRPPHCGSLGASATVNGKITGSKEEEG